MSTTKPSDGPNRDEDGDAAVRTVTQALRALDYDRERVTLDETASSTGLTPATVEEAMGTIDRVAPLNTRRVAEPGPVAWDVSL